MPRKLKLRVACREEGFEEGVLLSFIEREWLSPEALPLTEAEWELDEEDLARARLIIELREDLGVNDEAIPIILHLLDQLHSFRQLLKRAA